MSENRPPMSLGGYYFHCPKCNKQAERERLGRGANRADGAQQDRYRCRDCGEEFEDDAYVKVPLNEATLGDAFKQ